MALSGLACGADGLIVEVHPDPERALCDGSQTITPNELAAIVKAGHSLSTALFESAGLDEIAGEPASVAVLT
jgi:3-deoxy-7-phosphoheptulonate synthase